MIQINQEKFYELQGSLSDAKFASRLGISRSQLFRARNGYSAVGAGLFEGFMTAYPELDVREYFKCSGRLAGCSRGTIDEGR
jgi:hypothetical protein